MESLNNLLQTSKSLDKVQEKIVRDRISAALSLGWNEIRSMVKISL